MASIGSRRYREKSGNTRRPTAIILYGSRFAKRRENVWRPFFIFPTLRVHYPFNRERYFISVFLSRQTAFNGRARTRRYSVPLTVEFGRVRTVYHFKIMTLLMRSRDGVVSLFGGYFKCFGDLSPPLKGPVPYTNLDYDLRSAPAGHVVISAEKYAIFKDYLLFETESKRGYRY